MYLKNFCILQRKMVMFNVLSYYFYSLSYDIYGLFNLEGNIIR